jgi:hypothetical protein
MGEEYSKELIERMVMNERLLIEIKTGVDSLICSAYSPSINEYVNNEDSLICPSYSPSVNDYFYKLEKFFQFYEDDRKKPAPPFIPDDQKKDISQIPNPFSELRNKMHLYQAEEIEIERLKAEEDRLRRAGIIEPAYLMTLLQKEKPRLYKALCKAIADGLVKVIDNKWLNFICSKGSTAYFFKEGGFKDCKTLSNYIKINGEEIKESTLRYNMDNDSPKKWDSIKEKYYP